MDDTAELLIDETLIRWLEEDLATDASYLVEEALGKDGQSNPRHFRGDDVHPLVLDE